MRILSTVIQNAGPNEMRTAALALNLSLWLLIAQGVGRLIG